MTVLTNDNFEKEVFESDKPVIVDFWATWCGPCMMLTPVLNELASEREDIHFCKVNVDEQSELAVQFKIDSIPTLLFISDRKVLNRLSGYRDRGTLLRDIADTFD